jgi:hypothetical protein
LWVIGPLRKVVEDLNASAGKTRLVTIEAGTFDTSELLKF